MQGQASTRIRKMALILVLVVLAAAAGGQALGPVVLEKWITARMQAAGMEKARLSVVSVTFNSLDVRDLVLTDPDVSVGSIRVGYTFASLLKGRVKDIDISGLTYRHVVSAGPSAAKKTVPLAQSSLLTTHNLFFDQLRLRSACLEICLPESCHRIFADARLTAENDHQFDLFVSS